MQKKPNHNPSKKLHQKKKPQTNEREEKLHSTMAVYYVQDPEDLMTFYHF